ncbi:hypothetical protein EST38_g13089 [Candolleomyces aberdarensis]|uniref:Uncharacterized protein n=1 Tax=Candolleomyces aberdarensis TaxID=2316362 RepID=A0A4Q2D3S2_9AGAR|nr:hypothetical protein EST38_g13089 [Candolleomyces aberdarensis]
MNRLITVTTVTTTNRPPPSPPPPTSPHPRIMATSQLHSRQSSVDPYLPNTLSQETTTTINTSSAVRRESRLHNWISEQCRLMVQDMGMEVGGDGVDDEDVDEPPLFSASTYVPVAQRSVKAAAAASAVDPTPTSSHKKTDSAVSAGSSSSSFGPRTRSRSCCIRKNGISGGWYWRTSGSSSGGSLEQDSLLASYILPSHPHSTRGDSDVVVVGEEMLIEGDVVDARSDSLSLGFGSDSEEEEGAAAPATIARTVFVDAPEVQLVRVYGLSEDAWAGRYG